MAAKRHRFFALSAPRRITLLLSLLLAGAVLASMHLHLPLVQPYVAPHRFWLFVAAYGVLLLGVLLPGV